MSETVTVVTDSEVQTVTLTTGVQTVTFTEETTGETVTLNVGVAGPRGDTGPTGPTGPPGTPAPLPVSYELVAVSSWSLAHSFPYSPIVMLLSASGTQVYVTVEYPDATHVAITFPDPFTGTVILR
jgi:hypothetical protein